MGLLAPDTVAYIMRVRVTRRLRGQLRRVLERLGHHAMGIYYKRTRACGPPHQEFSIVLRVRAYVNRMKDPGGNKRLRTWSACAGTGRHHRPSCRLRGAVPQRTLPAVSTHGSAAWPAKPESPASRLHDTGGMRLIEVLLHGGTQLNG